MTRPKEPEDLGSGLGNFDATCDMRRGLGFLPLEAWLRDGEDPEQEEESPVFDPSEVWTHQTLEEVFEEVDRLIGCIPVQERADSVESPGRVEMTPPTGSFPGESSLSEAARAIARRTPIAWRFRLLLQVWKEEVAAISENTFCPPETALLMDPDAVTDWLIEKLGQLSELAGTVAKINLRVRAVCTPGTCEEEDAHRIVEAGRSIGALLKALIEWRAQVMASQLSRPFRRVGETLASSVDDGIRALSTFPEEALETIRSAVRELRHTQGLTPLDLELRVDFMAVNDVWPELMRALTEHRRLRHEYISAGHKLLDLARELGIDSDPG